LQKVLWQMSQKQENMTKKTLYLIILVAIIMVSCGGNKKTEYTHASSSAEEKDSMIYGLTCDGTNDSVIVFLPFKDGADPVTYNIEIAHSQGHIIGQPQIGDWVGVMLNPQDTTEATMVINLDQLKATWTFQVRPTWKDASKLSRRAIAHKFNELPDSMKEAYMIPREYGFTLKRSSVAEAVGRVRRQSSLVDDSPVEYPTVKNYTGWKCRNGHLILISTDGPRHTANAEGKEGGKYAGPKPKESYDTLDFVFMTDDSLVLMSHKNRRFAFHRKENARAANAEAQKAALKIQKVMK